MRGIGITNNGTLLSSNVSVLTATAPLFFSQGVNSEIISIGLSLSGVTAGTYNNLVVNTFGLVTGGSNIAYLTTNQNIAVSGDASGSGTTAITLTLATVNSSPGTFSSLVVNGKGLVTNGTNLSATGDATGTASGASIILTLAPTGVSAGTFTKITVNSKGLVTAATSLVSTDITTALGYTPSTPVVTTAGTYNNFVLNTAGQVTSGTLLTYLTTNQTITLSGDVSGSGTTAITATLATVNPTPGTFTSFVVNGKGLVTSGFNQAFTGDVSGTTSGVSTTLTLATVNASPGTFTALVVNGKGLVTSGANISFSGDATGTASGTSAALTLATVNASPGTFTSLIVNGKGLVTTGVNMTFTGDATGTASGSTVTLALATITSVGTYQNVIVNAKGQVTSGSALSSANVTTALGYTPSTPVVTTAGTYNTVVINSAGQVTAASNATYGGGSSSLALTLSGAVTGTASTTTGTLTLPTTFASNGTFLGNLTVVGSVTAAYVTATSQTVVGTGTDGTLFEDNFSTAYIGDILTAKPFFAILRTTGQTGSVNQTNYNSAPTFRNTLDDGSGNFSVPGNATIGTISGTTASFSGSVTAGTLITYYISSPLTPADNLSLFSPLTNIVGNGTGDALVVVDTSNPTGVNFNLIGGTGTINQVTNSVLAGAVVGPISSTGAYPTNFVNTNSLHGVTVSIAAVGTDGTTGYPYFDLNVSGTPNSTSTVQFMFNGNNNVTYGVTNGQTWSLSLFAALSAGSLANVTVGIQFNSTFSAFTPISGTTLSRYSFTKGISNQGVASPSMKFGFAYSPTSSGTAVNFTIRIAAPQIELNTAPTTYVPNSTLLFYNKYITVDASSNYNILAQNNTTNIFQLSDAGVLTLPAVSLSTNSNVVATTSFVKGQGYVSGTHGTATLSFGAAPGNSTASVTVGMTTIASTSYVDLSVGGTNSTSDHNSSEHQLANMLFSLTCSSITAGTGFTISAISNSGNISGAFIVNYLVSV